MMVVVVIQNCDGESGDDGSSLSKCSWWAWWWMISDLMMMRMVDDSLIMENWNYGDGDYGDCGDGE